jgi:hypothetical protein
MDTPAKGRPGFPQTTSGKSGTVGRDTIIMHNTNINEIGAPMEANVAPITPGSISTVPALYANKSKPPGSSNDYEIIAQSQGKLTSADFDSIFDHFNSGELSLNSEVEKEGRFAFGPYITGSDRYLVAVRTTESELRDAGRRVVIARQCVAVPYESAREVGAVYMDLFESMPTQEQLVPNGPPLRLPVLGLQRRVNSYTALLNQLQQEAGEVEGDKTAPGRGSSSDFLLSRPVDGALAGVPIDFTVWIASALLEAPVAIVGGEHLSLQERGLFLDSVLSLLPYGTRVSMQAATYAIRNALYSIRLVFANGDKVGKQLRVVWGEIPDPESLPGPISREYFNNLIVLTRDAPGLLGDTAPPFSVILSGLSSEREDMPLERGGGERAVEIVQRRNKAIITLILVRKGEATIEQVIELLDEGLANSLGKQGMLELLLYLGRDLPTTLHQVEIIIQGWTTYPNDASWDKALWPAVINCAQWLLSRGSSDKPAMALMKELCTICYKMGRLGLLIGNVVLPEVASAEQEQPSPIRRTAMDLLLIQLPKLVEEQERGRLGAKHVWMLFEAQRRVLYDVLLRASEVYKALEDFRLILQITYKYSEASRGDVNIFMTAWGFNNMKLMPDSIGSVIKLHPKYLLELVTEASNATFERQTGAVMLLLEPSAYWIAHHYAELNQSMRATLNRLPGKVINKVPKGYTNLAPLSSTLDFLLVVLPSDNSLSSPEYLDSALKGTKQDYEAYTRPFVTTALSLSNGVRFEVAKRMVAAVSTVPTELAHAKNNLYFLTEMWQLVQPEGSTTGPKQAVEPRYMQGRVLAQVKSFPELLDDETFKQYWQQKLKERYGPLLDLMALKKKLKDSVPVDEVANLCADIVLYAHEQSVEPSGKLEPESVEWRLETEEETKEIDHQVFDILEEEHYFTDEKQLWEFGYYWYARLENQHPATADGRQKAADMNVKFLAALVEGRLAPRFADKALDMMLFEMNADLYSDSCALPFLLDHVTIETVKGMRVYLQAMLVEVENKMKQLQGRNEPQKMEQHQDRDKPKKKKSILSGLLRQPSNE